MPERELHYHVTEGGRKGPVVTDRLVAGALAGERVAQIVHEQGRTGQVETRKLRHGGTLIEWSDETPVVARRDPDDPKAGYVPAEGPAERAYVSGDTVINVTACVSDHSGGDELLTATAEDWPIGVNKDGFWLLSGHDGLRCGPVTSRVGIRGTVNGLLASLGVLGNEELTHGTSCREEMGAVVQTHLTLVRCPNVLVHHKLAQAIPMRLFDEVDQPPAHGPTEVPDNPYVAVLLHGLRHLTFHAQTDSNGRAAVARVPYAAEHLETLRPELFRMYERGEWAAPARAA
jgi:hypothetical protein